MLELGLEPEVISHSGTLQPKTLQTDVQPKARCKSQENRVYAKAKLKFQQILVKPKAQAESLIRKIHLLAQHRFKQSQVQPELQPRSQQWLVQQKSLKQLQVLNEELRDQHS